MITNQPTNRPGPLENQQRRGKRKDKNNDSEINKSPASETLPPTIQTIPTIPPATISYQRPAMTKIPAPAPTSTIQRPLSPTKIQKQSRSSAPLLTSSPIANQPESMTISPADLLDLNIAISDSTSSFDPEFEKVYFDKKLTKAKLDMYNFKKLFRHYDSPPDCRFVQAQRKPRPNSDDSTT